MFIFKLLKTLPTLPQTCRLICAGMIYKTKIVKAETQMSKLLTNLSLTHTISLK